MSRGGPLSAFVFRDSAGEPALTSGVSEVGAPPNMSSEHIGATASPDPSATGTAMPADSEPALADVGGSEVLGRDGELGRDWEVKVLDEEGTRNALAPILAVVFREEQREEARIGVPGECVGEEGGDGLAALCTSIGWLDLMEKRGDGDEEDSETICC